MNPPLSEHKAQMHARVLQHLLLTTAVVDFDAEGSLGIEGFFAAKGGAMFGVLVAIDQEGNEVLLKAFSGSCLGRRNLPGWVGHLIDDDTFLQYERSFDPHIKELGKAMLQEQDEKKKSALSRTRSHLSRKALQAYYSLYRIPTITGDTVSLFDCFPDGKIPTGSGDCCAIKLLAYAFSHRMRPVSMAEFFFGNETADHKRTHLEFYGPCDEKCKPILERMLRLDIVYQDEDLVVVNKPAHLLSVPGRGEEKQDCIESRVRALFPQAPLQCAVHRLDMDTSGLLVLALTKHAHRALSLQFQNQSVDKQYVALLEGVLSSESGVITLPFRLDVENRPRQIYDELQGKWGTTRYKRLAVERLDNGMLVTRVLFTPHSGRTHQLRLHSSHPKGLGLPILGDRLYGTGMETRLHLHAQSLSFTHPTHNNRLHFMTKVPF